MLKNHPASPANPDVSFRLDPNNFVAIFKTLINEDLCNIGNYRVFGTIDQSVIDYKTSDSSII